MCRAEFGARTFRHLFAVVTAGSDGLVKPRGGRQVGGAGRVPVELNSGPRSPSGCEVWFPGGCRGAWIRYLPTNTDKTMKLHLFLSPFQQCFLQFLLLYIRSF